MKQDERLERLFKTYYQQMYRLARTMLYDADESRDVVSDVFAQIIQQQTVLLPETEERYLMTSVRNRCRNVLQNNAWFVFSGSKRHMMGEMFFHLPDLSIKVRPRYH